MKFKKFEKNRKSQKIIKTRKNQIRIEFRKKKGENIMKSHRLFWFLRKLDKRKIGLKTKLD